mmetsp:Transcript_44757/g.133725  ORF Transcript_44757/g.133725 Transcript_44757/m.133725 type:complete len:90 (-) Transcript_44757:144-413(-)|eukprot:CAMPEP_0175334198 /NCGR_PEP_ID=MMETSP0095-20121207/2668_1 /TAXON_ID=311494 /ORGANISM="Alexandrium monilatum, Strain CCMP3105" /LENGTH=89 /DNA_ID=CAMNT_0016631507 /DNA_START=42 /DNA_END=311 /DNA_ORIENTATION=-
MSAPIVPGIMCLASMGGLPRRGPESMRPASIDVQADIAVVTRCHSVFGDGKVGHYICGLRGEKVPASGLVKEAALSFTAAQECGVMNGV